MSVPDRADATRPTFDYLAARSTDVFRYHSEGE